MSEIMTFTEEQLAKECQIGCTCIICGGFIPMRGPQEHITPICINCIKTLRKIVLESRGQEHDPDENEYEQEIRNLRKGEE